MPVRPRGRGGHRPRAQEGPTHSGAAFLAPRGEPQALWRNAAAMRWALWLALSVLALPERAGAGAAAVEPPEVVVRAPARARAPRLRSQNHAVLTRNPRLVLSRRRC